MTVPLEDLADQAVEHDEPCAMRTERCEARWVGDFFERVVPALQPSACEGERLVPVIHFVAEDGAER